MSTIKQKQEARRIRAELNQIDIGASELRGSLSQIIRGNEIPGTAERILDQAADVLLDHEGIDYSDSRVAQALGCATGPSNEPS